MYMILWWQDDGCYMNCVSNEDGSIRLFGTLKEADKFANKHLNRDEMRVISIEGVNE